MLVINPINARYIAHGFIKIQSVIAIIDFLTLDFQLFDFKVTGKQADFRRQTRLNRGATLDIRVV